MIEGVNISTVRLLEGSSDISELNRSLSRALGKEVKFVPDRSGYKFSIPAKTSDRTNHWDVFETLAKSGSLTINGRELAFWRGMRESMLSGGEFNICTSNATAQAIVNEINFISGKSYRIVGGDPITKFEGPIHGNGLKELIENLSKMRGVKVSEY